MKLRIHKNSLRLRLSQTEVDLIAQGGAVQECLEFPGEIDTQLLYSLQPEKECHSISITFIHQEILIQIPEEEAIAWALSEKVGIYADIKIRENSTLSLQIEKDFQCLHKRPGEDESDNFPNPAVAGKKDQ